MTPHVWIVRYGELALKGGNRNYFEKRLVQNIRFCLRYSQVPYERIVRVRGRILVYTEADCTPLKTVFGISSFSPALEVPAEMQALTEAALHVPLHGSFKIATHRLDKSFPLTSQQVNERVGAALQSSTGAPVDLTHPDTTLGIEILKDVAYLFTDTSPGLRGLPVGTSGTVAVLLENERSLTAAYLMLKRGCIPVFVGDPSLDCTPLEKYLHRPVRVVRDIPSGIEAVVVADTLDAYQDRDLPFSIFRPLLGYPTTLKLP